MCFGQCTRAERSRKDGDVHRGPSIESGVGAGAGISQGQGPQRTVGSAGGQSIAFLKGDRALGIPFKIVDELIVVSAKLNDSTPVDLFLDTGFGSKGVVLFDPRLGRELGLNYVAKMNLGGGGNEGGETASVAVGASLSLPGVRIGNQQVIVMSGNGPFSDPVADGIVGGSLFDCVVEIDYDNRVLNLYKEVPQRVDESAERFDLSFTQGIPVVEAQVFLDGKETIPVKLIVDTGAGLPLFLFTYSNRMFRPPRTNIAARDEGLNGAMAYVAGRVPVLRLGKFMFRGIVTAFLDEKAMGSAVILGQNGFLGHETLQLFRVVFDYSKAHMFLRPNTRYGTDFDFNMAGLVLKTKRDGTIAVFDVVTNSPASQQGLKSGDLIVAINDRDIDSISADELCNLFVQQGKKVKLTVERDSQRLDFTLSLRQLI